MIDLDLKTLININGQTYFVSTVSMLVKSSENDDDFQTLVVKSEKYQDEKLGKYDIDYECIDWEHPIENHSCDNMDEAKRTHSLMVEKYRKMQGYCGVR